MSLNTTRELGSCSEANLEVPAAVPSLDHSVARSRPVWLVSAPKYSQPLYTVRSQGMEPNAEAPRSATIAVPAAVPAVAQSSVPLAAVEAVKYSLLPIGANLG